ncbi:hypothetical protein PG993_001669 [Apiospora rasikravindrae]|uniref:Uncharacterized protein n=1 Tax=Apiospora rasikravindrae TaxID=990691 RepID=A0ABR1UC11_9PEZI
MLFNCQIITLLCFLLFSRVTHATHDDGDEAIPASPAILAGVVGGELGFTPRYYAEGLALYRLGGRQAAGLSCADPTKVHTCGELGALGNNFCCPNDKYCFFGENWAVNCCSIGNSCDKCNDTHYLVNVTKTSTFDTTLGIVSTGSQPVVKQTFSEQTIESGGCMPRKCAASEFQCPESFGGNCCNFGIPCSSGGLCGVAITPSPSGFVPTANGCPSRNQFACAASLGGNCCYNGQTCVERDGTQGCTGQPTSPPGTEITYSGGGLSQSAKAGIGVGVAVGAAIIIGLATWFCIRHRRQARRSSAYPSNREYQSVGQAGQVGPAGAAGGTEVMSDVSGPSRGTGPHRTGLVYEYFGPTAVPGPFTQRDNETPHEPRGAWARFAPSAPTRRAVPVQPDNPGDIAAPVELGDDDAHLKAVQVQAAKTTPTPSVAPPASPEQQVEVFELWGSPGVEPFERSPLDEVEEPHQLHQQHQEERDRPISHLSSNTEYQNSQENPDPHSMAESGSTAAESTQDGNGHGNEVSTIATTESVQDGQEHRADLDSNHRLNNSSSQA